MPFTLSELVNLSQLLRDACLGIIKLAYPETKTEHREEYMAAFRSVGVKTNTEVQQRIQAEQKRWVQLFKVITPPAPIALAWQWLQIWFKACSDGGLVCNTATTLVCMLSPAKVRSSASPPVSVSPFYIQLSKYIPNKENGIPFKK